MKTFCFLAFLMISQISYSQSKKLSVQEITISDTLVVKQIMEMVKQYSQTDSLFRSGLGRISLTLKKSSNDTILRHYYLNPDSFYGIVGKDDDNYYPRYFSYVSNRLVLIYIEGLQDVFQVDYTKKSKQKLQKKIDNFLEKKKKIALPDSTNSISIAKNFRGNPYTYMNSGIDIFIYKDGSIKSLKSRH